MARTTSQSLPLVALRGRVIFPSATVSFDVGRLSSLTAVKSATDGDSRLFVVTQKDADKNEITPADVYDVGTVVRLKQVTRLPGNNIRITVEGLFRAAARSMEEAEHMLVAEVDEIKTVHGEKSLEEAYFRTAKDIMHEISQGETRISKDVVAALERCTDPDEFVNLAANSIKCKLETKQQLLENPRLIERLRDLDKVLNEELEIMRLERKINNMVRAGIDKNQKEYYLREQLKAIHTELGDDEEERDELERKIKENYYTKITQ